MYKQNQGAIIALSQHVESELNGQREEMIQNALPLGEGPVTTQRLVDAVRMLIIENVFSVGEVVSPIHKDDNENKEIIVPAIESFHYLNTMLLATNVRAVPVGDGWDVVVIEL
jgi:hypothetical protein